MEWFRFYTKTLESAKVQKLPDKLFKAWVNFMCIARIFDGVLPSHTEIAFRLRISPERALKLTHELKKAGLIDDACDQKRAQELKRNGRKDMVGDRFLVMHDWDQWQCVSDDSAARKSKQRSYAKLSRDIERDIYGTSPVLEQSRTDTEQIQNRTDGVVVPFAAPHWPQDFDFEEWFQRRMSKHPLPGKPQIAKGYALEKVWGSFRPEEFDASHDAWCDYWSSQTGGIPSLATFLFEDWWKRAPPIVKKKLTWEEERAIRWKQEDEEAARDAS